MKTSAIKYLKVWINKKKSKKEIILSTVVTLLLLIIFTYFLRPAFYNYETEKNHVLKAMETFLHPHVLKQKGENNGL